MARLNRRVKEAPTIEDSDPLFQNKKGKKRHVTLNKRGTDLKKKEVIKVLEEQGGLITHAARILGCSYKVLRRFIDNNSRVQKALATIKLVNVEAAERSLRYLVEAGNLGAICFTLKCQGRDRGWVENTDINLPTVPIVFKYVSAIPPQPTKDTK